jgi:hypothetical protein
MGWWADKLNGGQQQQAPATWTPQPPQQWTPPGHTQQPQGYYPQPQWQGQPQQPQAPQPVEFGGMIINDGATFFRVMQTGNAKNGAAKHEHGVCPECGDPRYFALTHKKFRKVNLNTGQSCEPAPICEACGYNGLFEQYGNQAALQTDQEAS